MVWYFRRSKPSGAPGTLKCPVMSGMYVFIYLLFIRLGARRLWPVLEGNKHQQKQQNRYANTGAQTRQRKSSTRPQPSPIHPRSVIQKIKSCVVVIPPRHWFCILCRSSWTWPCAWVLPLEFAHSSPSIPLPQLSHSPPLSSSASSPVFPLEPL